MAPPLATLARISIPSLLLALSLQTPLLAQEKLIAWGSNTHGQTNVPSLPGGMAYAQHAAGANHNLALRSDNTVVAWGLNTSGQCNVAALPSGVHYTGVGAAANTSFGVRSDGLISGWGLATNGLLTIPALLPSTTYAAVYSSPAASHALARRSDGWLAAWGLNTSGQCTVPALPPGLAYTAGAAGSTHSLGLRSDGTIIGWGSNSNGQTTVPALPAGVVYTAVAAGDRFSLALRSDGSIVGWGLNSSGQTAVPALPAGMVYTKVSAAPAGGYAVRSDGLIVNWATSNGAPTPSLTRYTTISAGGAHAVGFREPVCEGLAYCTAKTNTIGCVPSMSYAGTPTLSGADDFFVTASNLTSQQAGVLIWSTAPFFQPFYGGTLCVAPPIVRTSPQNSGGNPAQFDCTGTFAFHFSHAYMAAQGFLPGTAYYAQYWMRDVHDPLSLHVGLTDGLAFMICQ